MGLATAAPSDSELARRAGQGDQAAFSALYERWFDPLHDFAARIVRDRDLAADVVHSTFVSAWEAFGRGEVRNPRAWLYATARNAAIDELRRRERVVGGEGGAAALELAPAGESSDPESVLRDRELVELVWESAAALSPQDYSLLDMHVRRGLDSEEMAGALGLRKGAVYTRVSRMKDALERAVVARILARRPECDELRALVDGRELDARLVRELHAHVKRCDACQRSRRRLASAASILAATPPLPAVVGAREEVWRLVAEDIAASPRAPAGAPSAEAARSRRRRRAALLAVLLLLAGGGLAAAIGLRGSPDPPVRDPLRLFSTSHRIDVPSTDPTIDMVWSAGREADGYSVVFTHADGTLPDQRVDVRGLRTTSPPLAPGRWWFHLRTRGEDGDWTSTRHSGPYLIVARERAGRRAAGRKRRRAQRRSRSDEAPSSPQEDQTDTQPQAEGPQPVQPRTTPRGPAEPREEPRTEPETTRPETEPEPAPPAPPTTTAPPPTQPPTTTEPPTTTQPPPTQPPHPPPGP